MELVVKSRVELLNMSRVDLKLQSFAILLMQILIRNFSFCFTLSPKTMYL